MRKQLHSINNFATIFSGTGIESEGESNGMEDEPSSSVTSVHELRTVSVNKGPCPICNILIPYSIMQEHANACLDEKDFDVLISDEVTEIFFFSGFNRPVTCYRLPNSVKNIFELCSFE